MIIKILWSGCPKCKTLYELVESTTKDLWINASIIKIEDMWKILEYDIMSTPALVIDEKIVFEWWIPSNQELQDIFLNPNKKTIKNDDCCGKCCC